MITSTKSVNPSRAHDFRRKFWPAVILATFTLFVTIVLLLVGRLSSAEAEQLDLSLVEAASVRGQLSGVVQVPTSPIVIPAAACIPYGDDFQWSFSPGGGYIHPDGSSFICIGQVNLPDRAIMTELIAYIYDNDPDETTSNRLMAKEYKSLQNSQVLTWLESFDDSTEIQALSHKVNHVVNNSKYIYFFSIDMRSTTDAHRFLSFEIYFGRPVFLPVLMNQ